MAVDRNQEQFAFAVVGRVLGVEVEEYDVDGRQNAVDAVLHYPDGRTGALEVSSVGPMKEARISNVLASRRHKLGLSDVKRTWFVSVPRELNPKDLAKVGQALLLCEGRGLTRLEQACDDETVMMLLEKRVQASAPDIQGEREPTVWLMPEILGGFTGRGTAELQTELRAVFQTDIMRSKLTKLAKSDHAERHLFLYVRESAFSFPIYDNLAFGGRLPTEPPVLPDGLDQLWLASGWKDGGIVRAIASGAWSRTHPFD